LVPERISEELIKQADERLEDTGISFEKIAGHSGNGPIF
jgi:hypothetical protein